MPPHATVMMSGSMPPRPEKWCMPFHYPNFYNDMWRIYGLVFFNDAAHFQVGEEHRFDPERIRDFLYQRGIALVPTVRKAIREHGNASDKHLTIVETVDLATTIAQLPDCRWIMTTGGKATDIILSLCEHEDKAPKTNQSIPIHIDERSLTLYRLPSTSRAYPLALAKKADAYRTFFQLAGLL
ncbi:DNA glycosylase [Cardiobacteriaceae bacterium TAE3-ERU3]|nr:DNA glycosylase [Cardiobacteriaceae bacterium TAE3-ERU3]